MRALLLAAILLGSELTLEVRAQDAFGPAAAPPAAQSFHLGKLTLTALHCAQIVLPNDAKIFGVDAGAAAVGELLRASGAPAERITLSSSALLVRTEGRVLLLDT